MRRRSYPAVVAAILLLLPLFTLVFFPVPANSGTAGAVYLFPVKGTIDSGMVLYLQRAFAEIDAAEGAVILLFNTLGGYLDAALEIRDLLEESPLPVYSYVQSRAISAGAYLALSSEALFMAPGSTIGAAEPRLVGAGEPVDEKTLSSWEAEMRGAAEQQGKNPAVAAAMVRRDLEIPGVVEKGELLTLTGSQAEEIGLADGLFSSVSELQDYLGLDRFPLVRQDPTAGERLSGWLTSPLTATLLLAIAIAALVIEVLTAGFGVAGIISLIAFGLYFGGHITAGVAGYESIVLFIVGIVLMLIEAFIPGFGIFGAGGLVALVAAIILAAATSRMGVIMLLIALALAGVIIYVAFRFLKKRGLLDRVMLSEAEKRELGYIALRDLTHLSGRRGVTATPLRPSGAVEIDGERVDVVSEGGFLPPGQEVVVVKVEGRRVVVRPIKEEGGK